MRGDLAGVSAWLSGDRTPCGHHPSLWCTAECDSPAGDEAQAAEDAQRQPGEDQDGGGNDDDARW